MVRDLFADEGGFVLLAANLAVADGTKFELLDFVLKSR